MERNIIEKNRIYETFFKLKEILYIVKDDNGNILYPHDVCVLRLYQEILTSKIKSGNQFYHKDSKTWYKKSSKKIVDDNGKILLIEFFENVTKTKEEIYNLKIDALTKLLKDRGESDKLVFEYINYALNEKEEFSVVMADVDEFKTINDTYGHACGDMVLKNVGLLLLKSTRQSEDKFDYRPSDIVVRIGGDEFFILLKNISLEDTKHKIDSLQQRVKNLDLTYTGNCIPVQMSFGYCHANNNFSNVSNIELLKESMSKVADEYLYINKNRKKIEQMKELEYIKKMRN